MTDQPMPVYITGERYGQSPLQLTDNEERDFLFADQEKKQSSVDFMPVISHATDSP